MGKIKITDSKNKHYKRMEKKAMAQSSDMEMKNEGNDNESSQVTDNS